MYSCTIDVLMLNNINHLLKDKGYSCTAHAIAGCTCHGIYLKNLADASLVEEIMNLINDFLKPKYIYIIPGDNPLEFKIKSVFDK